MSKVATVKDEELDALSEEEQKALLDDPETIEGDPGAGKEETAAEKAKGETAGTKPTEEEAAEAKRIEDERIAKEAGDKEAGDKDKLDAEKPKGEEGEAEALVAPTVSEEFIPQYQAEPVENFDEKMKEFNEKKDAFKQQYSDGDLSMTELLDGRDEVEKEIRALEMQQTKHEMSREQIQQSGEQRWQWEQDRFFNTEANKAYKDNPLLGAAIDTAIKTLAGDDKNDGKPMSWFLEEADRNVRALFNPNAAQPKDEDEGNNAATKDDADKTKRKVDLSKIPLNLGDLPAADLVDTGGDEFSKLDKLDGMELETALAAMSQAEQDRYLKG